MADDCDRGRADAVARVKSLRRQGPPGVALCEELGFGGIAGRDEPGLVGDHHGLRPVPEVQLVEDAADMSLHRAFAERQTAGDLRIRQSSPDQGQDLSFPRRQLVEYTLVVVAVAGLLLTRTSMPAAVRSPTAA